MNSVLNVHLRVFLPHAISKIY